MKKLYAFAIGLMTIVSCGNGGSSSKNGESKTLVLYYSQTGATKTVAETFAKSLGADIEAITVVDPYGDYNQTIIRGQQELNTGKYPELNKLNVKIKDYDTIFLGFPVWFGTYANPIASLIQNENFAGKTIVPFCTFGSGGRNTSEAALQAALPKSTILPSYGVRNARIAAAADEIDHFLKENGYIEGEYEYYEEFMAQYPVTEREYDIFMQAISTYDMLKSAQPISYAYRTTSKGTDYLFNASDVRPDGSKTPMQVCVSVSNIEGSSPEFTEVLR